MSGPYAPRALPAALAALQDLALDLRWTWSHGADHLWRTLDPGAWERLENPWTLLQDISEERLGAVATDPVAAAELARLTAARQAYLADGGWFARSHAGDVRGIAYFSMEFGLGEALPLYAGGLGILAGDLLKTASDLGVPVVGIGLLYQEGFFRQVLDTDGRQRELYPFNDPTSLPIEPVRGRDGAWLHVTLDLPGRSLFLRVWRARVGRASLYLLDSNDPLNAPADRGITGRLYGGDEDTRFMQEVVLGVAGWRLVEALALDIEICHLNEGHAAFAILERARSFMRRTGAPFDVALWATRAANVFTTHTAVAAAFDSYDANFVERHRPMLEPYVASLGLSFAQLMSLGRRRPDDSEEPFTLSYLAIRGSVSTNAVSRLHAEVSRQLFRELFPRWPEREVPIVHVTNGVHVPTWDSPSFDALWERRCGKARWLGALDELPAAIASATDQELWKARVESRHALVALVRRRLARQVTMRGADAGVIVETAHAFDPDALTIGFARRFTSYKRPTLLLTDPARLARLLTDVQRPIQLVIAGKAHPRDEQGKELIARWVRFAQEPANRMRMAFLEDYDMTLAEELVRGVDLWLNTPRRPWEASGTSGMKVLANGGLNLSEVDGWWAEAFTADVGWAIGDGRVHDEAEWDAHEAEQLYRLLEEEIVPLFYTRDKRDVPTGWLARVRQSISTLAPRFSANRMLREYVESMYVPAATVLRRRAASAAHEARELADWERSLRQHWAAISLGPLDISEDDDGDVHFAVAVDLGPIDPCSVSVELYADPIAHFDAVVVALDRGAPIAGAVNGAIYHAHLHTERPAWHFTARVLPRHGSARIPAELPLIHWQQR